jgi:hypothetical protein
VSTLSFQRNNNSQTTYGLSEIELLNLDEEGKVPKGSRLTDVEAALGIFSALLRADEKANVNRSRVQSMFDGAPPYDPAVLKSTLQAGRCNLNFGEAARYLDIAASGYVDLVDSVENLVQVETKLGEPGERMHNDAVIAEEITRTLRDWPEFYGTYLRLNNQFLMHGVGVTYFEDDQNFRFRTCGLADFLIPRQTQASEHAVEVACARRSYMVHELFAFIENESVATQSGWNVEEVKRVIRTASSLAFPRQYSDWEDLQREIKNNDLYTGIRANVVNVINMWVREFDGTVSQFCFAENQPKAFMSQRTHTFENPEQAYILFTYGVGTNGSYHSVRGLGHRIYNHIQTSNRLQCQMVDSAMLSSSIMLSPETPRALNDLSLTFYGPYSVLPPNFKVIEKGIPNAGTTVVPAMQNLSQQLSQNMDFFSNSTGQGQQGPYRSKQQVQAELEQATRLTSSQINQFYASWRRLLRECVRRIVLGPKSDPAVRDFYNRCLERGVSPQVIKSLDFNKTLATRAVGSGNATNRSAALGDLEQLMPMLDEVGKRNVLYDRVAARVGYENAARYVSSPESPRPPQDAKIAELENNILSQGRPVTAQPGELDETHLQIHLGALGQITAAIDGGQADLVQQAPIMQAFYEHCSAHLQQLASNPAAQVTVSQVKEVLSQVEQKLMNAQRAMQKQQRDAQNAQGQEQPEQGGNGQLTDLKAQEQQLKLDFIRKKGELELQIKSAKADQDRALADSRNAAALQAQ